MTDLFAAAAGFAAPALLARIPPSVRRGVAAVPPARRDGDDLVLELGPWSPRTPARHLVPSLALMTPRPYGVRFELAVGRSGVWSAWAATVTLGDEVFAALPAAEDLSADIDEVRARVPFDDVRLRVRLRAPAGAALLDAPLLITLSVSDGSVPAPSASPAAAVALAVPARTQMSEDPRWRMHVCSPTSVGMVMQFFGCAVPTSVLAADIYHPGTDRYGIWPAAVRAAAGHGVPGYLLRFPDWSTAQWCLGQGLPIVASVRYGAGALTGAAMPATAGHLLVLTGFDGDSVFVNDPAAPDEATVARRYRRDELERAWLGGSGVGYVFVPPG